MNEQVLADTAFYLDLLSPFDYSNQLSLITSLLPSLPLSHPLPPRFTIRPMTPRDIPGCAHLLAHAFGEHGVLNLALQNANFAKSINNWIAWLRITLCDHCSFVVEDAEFSSDPGL
jgi:hypothetical protein